jgi:hypothetical protein
MQSQKELETTTIKPGELQKIEKKISLISRTFVAAYPNIYLSLLGNNDNYEDWKSIWNHVVSRLETSLVEKTLKKIILTSEFPPSPAQFLKVALNIIPAEQAYAAIGDNELAQEAYSYIDSWFKKTAPEKEVKQEFIAIYKNLVEKLLTGEQR